MPSTLTGLLLFVALLLPGFAYVALLRRERPAYRPSALQETASVAAASVVADAAVLGLFALVRALAPSWTPDVARLITQPRDYLAADWLPVFGWTAVLLLAACGLAVLGGRVLAGWPVHRSAMSSWWSLFEVWPEGRDTRVQCELDDGSYVEGQLADWNDLADDSPDRDLILQAPIVCRAAGSSDYRPHPVNVVCVSARRVVRMFVAYSDPAAPTGSSVSRGAEAAGEAAPTEEAQ